MVPLNFDTPEVVLEIDQLKILAFIKAHPTSPMTEYRTPGLVEFILHGVIPSNSNREKYTLSCELLWDKIISWGPGDIRSRAIEPLLP
jgi:hypothetical protein